MSSLYSCGEGMAAAQGSQQAGAQASPSTSHSLRSCQGSCMHCPHTAPPQRTSIYDTRSRNSRSWQELISWNTSCGQGSAGWQGQQ